MTQPQNLVELRIQRVQKMLESFPELSWTEAEEALLFIDNTHKPERKATPGEIVSEMLWIFLVLMFAVGLLIWSMKLVVG